MRKVLVITYRFPPSGKVGALRSRGIARYLPEFGWKPVFIVPVLFGKPESSFTLIETHPPYRKMLKYYFDREGKKRLKNILLPLPPLYKRAYSFMRGAVDFPDNMAGWFPFAEKAARDTIITERIKHMITISGPMSCHLTGLSIKKQFPEIFWLADYRDPWTIHENGSALKRLEKKMERNVISSVDAISIVTPQWAEEYRRFFPGKKVYTIPNGFDTCEINTGDSKLADEFTITHTGELYRGDMTPEPLFIALSELMRENKVSSFSLKFFGSKQKWLIPMAKKYGIRNFVHYYGRIERNEILAMQKESHVLFLPEIRFLNGKGRLTAKIYEYLAAMRPVIYTGKEDTAIAHFLNETQAGFTCPNVETAKNVLLQLYSQWKKCGTVDYTGLKKEILKYTHREMARKFAESLEGGGNS